MEYREQKGNRSPKNKKFNCAEKSRTHIEQKGESKHEETGMKDISNFDPRIVSHRGINDDDTSKLYKKIK